jgi:hypothetical protein
VRPSWRTNNGRSVDVTENWELITLINMIGLNLNGL